MEALERLKPGWCRGPMYNTVVLGMAFFWVFLGAATLQSYESTLNHQDGLISLGLVYLGFGLSSLLASQIHALVGSRLSMLVAGVCYALYILTNIFYYLPVYYAASLLVGFAATMLWTAQGAFLTRQSSAENPGFYSGLFLAIYQSEGIFGYLITQLLVSGGVLPDFILYLFVVFVVIGTLHFFLLSYPSSSPAAEMYTFVPQSGDDDGHLDGDGDDLPAETIDDHDEDPQVQSFSDPPPVKDKSTGWRKWVPKLSLTILLQPKFGHLLPLMVFTGLQKSFQAGPFPPLFGPQLIGWGLLCFAASNVVSSLLSGRLIDSAGRRPVLLLAAVFQVLGVTCANLGNRGPLLPVLFVASACLGIADAAFSALFYVFIKDLCVGDCQVTRGFGCVSFVRTLFTAGAFIYSIYLSLLAISTLLIGALVLALIFLVYLHIFIHPIR